MSFAMLLKQKKRIIWNIDKKMSSNSIDKSISEEFCLKCVTKFRFPAIELSKDAIWAIQIMQEIAMQNLSRLVMGA